MPYILTIQERSNSWAGRPAASSSHATRGEAEAELRDYVLRNWDSEMGTAHPDDPDEAVSAYFSEVLENYEITQTIPAPKKHLVAAPLFNKG